MELIKKNIHMEHRINKISTQISLEEDQNISDQKPDASKIICKNACVKVDEIKPADGAAWVRGNLNYTVLYLTEEKEKRLCSMEGSMPFEEKIYLETEVMGDSLRVQTKVDDLTMRLINSRKLNIRSVIGFCISQEELYDEDVVVDVENPQTCEILKKPMDVTTIVLDTRDIYRIREEVSVPDGFPNIYSLIWKEVSVDGLNFTLMDGRIGISGELNAFFLYEGEEENATPRCFDINRAFGGVLEIPDCKEDMLLRVDYEIEPVHVETKADYDGEERQIDLDIEMKLYIKLYRDMTLSVVSDAYGIQECMTPVMKEGMFEKILKKESGKIKVSDVWENEEHAGMVRILYASASVLEEEVTLQEKKAELSGVVHAQVLGMTGDENEPYRCITLDIPYEHTVAINGESSRCTCVCRVCIEQVTATIQGDRVDVRVILNYNLSVSQILSRELLADLKKTEPAASDQSLPVMSVYFADENETIWEVGKKYQVPLGTIRELNGLSTDELQKGQKVLIVKALVS